jgi:hypothetical protein
MMTDAQFSTLQAYSKYKYEVFLNSNTSMITPDATEYAFNIAPVYSPKTMTSMFHNDVTPSTALATAPAASAASLNISWTNIANAAPVYGVQVFATSASLAASAASSVDYSTTVNAAYSVGARPTSQTVTAAASSPIPALTTGASDMRYIAIWAYQGRSYIQNLLEWKN